jgi:hypothetical protein
MTKNSGRVIRVQYGIGLWLSLWGLALALPVAGWTVYHDSSADPTALLALVFISLIVVSVATTLIRSITLGSTEFAVDYYIRGSKHHAYEDVVDLRGPRISTRHTTIPLIDVKNLAAIKIAIRERMHPARVDNLQEPFSLRQTVTGIALIIGPGVTAMAATILFQHELGIPHEWMDVAIFSAFVGTTMPALWIANRLYTDR